MIIPSDLLMTVVVCRGEAVSIHASFYEKFGYDEYPKVLNNLPKELLMIWFEMIFMYILRGKKK